MNTLLKPILLSFIIILPVDALAGVCNEQSRWWPICRYDPASGPDVGTSEWMACRGRGGCNYN